MKKLVCIGILLSLLFIPYSKLEASGNSVIILEATTKRVLYEKNIHERHLTASIAKILTAIVAIEEGNLFDMVKVNRESTLVEGSSIYLQEGDELLLIDLVYGLMLRSGNDAATLISQSVCPTTEEFVRLMNRYAKIIGMKNSTFENPTGLDATSKNYSTAYDMALLMAYAMENEAFRMITGTKNYRSQTKNNVYMWSNKHRLIGKNNVVGGKTGYTKTSGRTLVSYFEKDNKRMVCVTFKIGGDFSLHSALFSEYERKYEFYPIMKSKVFSQKIEGLNYYPYLKNDIILPLKEDEISNISVELHLKQYCDTDCGKIKILAKGKIIYEQLIGFYPLKEGT